MSTLRLEPGRSSFHVQRLARPAGPGTSAWLRRAAALLALPVLLAGSAGEASSKPAGAPAARAGVETATFSGGCFWSMNAIFSRLRGVKSVTAGFSGGSVANPTYEQVCTGRTGHAESVQITFDPAMISYRDLLHVFFAFHDPTTPNRQGADVGTQYRSAVFWHTPAQRAEVVRTIAELEKQRVFESRIVTQVEPYRVFYAAEGYHQGYYDKNANLPYCRMVIGPKVAKLRSQYASRLKTSM